MQEDNITPDTLPDASQLNAAGADGAVGSVSAGVDSLSLSELNTLLNKDFKDKDTALKSVKDTFAFVGKKKDQFESEILAKIGNDKRIDTLAQELAIERKERFYDKNPQYASMRTLIDKLGSNPSEVVNSPEFKEIHTKVSGYDESTKLRTVLESNPRLASSRDALTKAKEMQMNGSGSQAEHDSLIVNAVKDAFDLK